MDNETPSSEPAPIKRVVIHIGSTKTGSSALQTALFKRREELAAAGVHYSRLGVHFGPDGVPSGAHHLLSAAIHPGAWRMHTGDIPEDRVGYFNETARRIAADAAAENAHTIVLSSEYWWGSFPVSMYRAVAAAFAPARFEVVAFIRRQDEWAMSSYLQAVKSGETRDFRDWAERALFKTGSGLNYFRVINRWAYLTHAQKVHVLRYQDVKDNVFAAFCDTIGADVDKTIPVARVNPSPSAEGVQLLLEINRSDMTDAEKKAERAQVMGKHRSTGPLAMLLTAEEREATFKESRESDALIVRRFLDREPPLFDLEEAEAEARAPEPAP
ncbi:hypothetical protein [Acuticoccus sp. I52.16.1]|uniref:hypothetical protein n=1 Tax=Acuticoccus sp. I52.16.1 TaxID=2928472 RepID=UPI001FD33872|nr:hypothetical protein [Acuticoccus sp. I52.16.1]UOM34654.1 hypothetical protein MRB58_00095 [Acuticoccus sp. I52.16.1]